MSPRRSRVSRSRFAASDATGTEPTPRYGNAISLVGSSGRRFSDRFGPGVMRFGYGATSRAAWSSRSTAARLPKPSGRERPPLPGLRESQRRDADSPPTASSFGDAGLVITAIATGSGLRLGLAVTAVGLGFRHG